MSIRFALFATYFVLAGVATAAPPGASPPKMVAGYEVVVSPANIAPTAATAARDPVEVIGQPRKAEGHPRTIWDRQDIEEYREKLKTDRALQASYNRLKSDMDKRMEQPLGVPDVKPAPSTVDDYRAHSKNSWTMVNLAIVHAISGEEKYAEYCRRMLLAYAQNYPRYSHTEGWTETRYRSAHDGRLTGQFLDDGFWLMRVAFAYDLVHSFKSWTPEDRKLVRDDLFNAICAEFYHPVLRETDYINAEHNRSVICVAGMLIAGYACEDQKLIDLALYGQGGTPEKPKGGVFGTHFTNRCILPDGLWLEGAPAYQLGITSCGLFATSETLWRNGIDMYRHENGLLKRLLDSSIALAYPDASMTVAALHDSAQMALLDDRNWVANETGVPYQIGYRRYGDPRYVPIVRNSQQSISMTIHSGPPSLYLDIPSDAQPPARPIAHANFHAVGYGVQRLAAAKSPVQVILEFGPSGSHGHPSKLGIDLYALDDVLMPFPGVIFPYNDPLDPSWYWTTLANSVVTVDEKNQITAGERWRYPRGTPNPEARQILFGPAETLSIQRAASGNLYLEPVTQDRSLFVTPDYLADLYGVFAETSHTYDLAWHFRGKMTCDLSLEPFQFPDKAPNGYNALTDVRRGAVPADRPWSAQVVNAKGHPIRFLAPATAADEVIIGNGHFFTKNTRNDERPPTLIQRRTGANVTVFGNVIDISGAAEPYVKRIEQQGSLQDGFALLRIQTVRGTDLCFAAFKAGVHKTDALETDAQQAMVIRDADHVRAAYLGGGTMLKAPGVSITRREPGLAVVERLDDGSYIISNPSPVDASIGVVLPALAGASVPGGTACGPDGSFSVTLKAGDRVQFQPKQ